MVIPLMLRFPDFLIVFSRFRMSLPVFLPFPSVFFPFPRSVSPASYFRFYNSWLSSTEAFL